MEEQVSQTADEEQFERRLAKLDALAAELKQVEQAVGAGTETQPADAPSIARRRAQLVAQEARFEEEAERLEVRRELTRIQRRRIASWLKADRNALIQEREAFQRESKHAQQQLRRERARWDKEREEFDEWRRNIEAKLGDGAPAVDSAELAELQSDRSTLNARVQQLEHQLSEAEHRLATQSHEHHASQIDDLQRRFELAIEDVRELKHRNAELEEALAEIQAAQGDDGASAGGQDWKATRSRLLSLLKKDSDEDQPLDADHRLTVEGAIRITDDIVARRDQEIEALKAQLTQPAAESDSASNEQLFNQDDIIRQERDHLAALKHELREKLRQAEVELSVQRAGLARERAELQEKLRALESEREELAALHIGNKATSGGKPEKPARRWLERMGLKELDQ